MHTKAILMAAGVLCMALVSTAALADRVFLPGDDRVFCNNLILEPDSVSLFKTACQEYDALRAQSMQDVLALIENLTSQFDMVDEDTEADKITALGAALETKLLELQILFKTHYQDKHAAIHDSVFTNERLDNNTMVQAYGNMLRGVIWFSNTGNRSQACIFELQTKLEALEEPAKNIDKTYRLLLRALGAKDLTRKKVMEIVSPNDVYLMWTRLTTVMETLSTFKKGYGSFLSLYDPRKNSALKQYDAAMSEALETLSRSTRGKHWEELYTQALPAIKETKEAFKDSYATLQQMHTDYFSESLFGYFQEGILSDGASALNTLKDLYTWYMTL